MIGRTIVLAAVIAGASVRVDPAPVRRLESPTGSVVLRTSAATAVRELADGRTLVAEGPERTILVVDWRDNHIDAVPGPQPCCGLVALPGDSTLLVSLVSGTLGFLVGDHPTPLPSGIDQWINPRIPMRGLDSVGGGHVASPPAASIIRRESVPGRPDSDFVVRVDRASGHVDTVTRVLLAPTPRAGDPPALYLAGELVVLHADGWMSVVRINPYRVDWRSPDGHWTLGHPIAGSAVPMDRREKEAFFKRSGRRLGVESIGDVPSWPTEVPPVTIERPLFAAPDGNVVVYRTPTAALPGERYDVVNRHGDVDFQLVLADGERVLGFGPHSVYVVHSSSDGRTVLARHPWAPR